MQTPRNGKRYRTIFVSDIHLGARACQAGFFLDFLRHHEADTFYLVGGGPQLEPLRAKYPDAIFTGPKRGEDLARYYASANVFVFHSLTDTFGIVLLEALASGVPVAAYPVTGPKDVVENGVVGALHRDLGTAALAALALDPAKCRTHALKYSWSNCARQFIDNIVAASGEARPQKKRPG